MKLVCGLGNPGREYSLSRHNLGYLVIDKLCRRFSLKLKPGKGDFLHAVLSSPPDGIHERVVLAKPTLFMNASGLAASQLTQQYRSDPSDLLVVCDDVNLPFGKIRLRKRGSHGGHRGLESVIYQLETEEIPRLRIGVGDSVEGEVLKEYVLQEFDEAERSRLPQVVAGASDAVIIYLSEPMEKAMSMVNATNTL